MESYENRAVQSLIEAGKHAETSVREDVLTVLAPFYPNLCLHAGPSVIQIIEEYRANPASVWGEDDPNLLMIVNVFHSTFHDLDTTWRLQRNYKERVEGS